MQEFDIQFEAASAEGSTREILEAGRVLAERAAGVLEERVAETAGEQVPDALPVGTDRPQDQVIHGITTTADGNGTEFAPLTAAKTEAAVDATLRKERGTGLHCTHELVREYVGHILGARTLR